ncbi:hypothetical protein VKT23_012294 [Stygiomarasmius scandens]|uniref:Uncharacterized protein n=1 Tax=Marasmiellus scandens TaxID=2682957 RepID=A0ABR1JC02_9AGAR
MADVTDHFLKDVAAIGTEDDSDGLDHPHNEDREVDHNRISDKLIFIVGCFVGICVFAVLLVITILLLFKHRIKAKERDSEKGFDPNKMVKPPAAILSTTTLVSVQS